MKLLFSSIDKCICTLCTIWPFVNDTLFPPSDKLYNLVHNNNIIISISEICLFLKNGEVQVFDAINLVSVLFHNTYCTCM